jgi:hypothetical protein
MSTSSPASHRRVTGTALSTVTGHGMRTGSEAGMAPAERRLTLATEGHNDKANPSDPRFVVQMVDSPLTGSNL